MTSGEAVPMYHLLPADEPPPDKTGWAEQMTVQMINMGYAMLHAFRDFDRAPFPTLLELDVPNPDEPDTYFDAIANLLQAADHAGMDLADICKRAIEQQRGFKREGQDEADHLRGRGVLPPSWSVQLPTLTSPPAADAGVGEEIR